MRAKTGFAERLPLYDYGARFYDPQLGRFLQPDSIVPDPYTPQSLNRYSYVLNSPPNWTDPSGNTPLYPDYGSYEGGGGLPLPDWESQSSDLETGGSAGFGPFAGWGGGQQFYYESGGSRRSHRRNTANFSLSSEILKLVPTASGPVSQAPPGQLPSSFFEPPKAAFLPVTPAATTCGSGPCDFSGNPSGAEIVAAGIPAALLAAPLRFANAGGFIRSFVTKTDRIFYRVFSGDATVGRYLTAIRPRTAAFARQALSLPPGNKAEFIQEVLVPAGTRLQRSRALPAFGGRGGAEQFEVLGTLPPASFGPGMPLP